MYIRHQNPVVCPSEPTSASAAVCQDALPQDVQLQEADSHTIDSVEDPGMNTTVTHCNDGMNNSSDESSNSSSCGESENEGIPLLNDCDVQEFGSVLPASCASEGTLSTSCASANKDTNLSRSQPNIIPEKSYCRCSSYLYVYKLFSTT
jgi:hypothetical protein